jgi:glycerol-3-phosphate acyltransferase PlsX
MVRIAVDAMGGDRAPEVVVSGAIEAARWSRGRYEVILVGDQKAIENELKRHHFLRGLKYSVVHASQKVEMDEQPGMALRKKPDSSIAVMTKLHKEGAVDGILSAGNTGAVMGAALFILKPIEGVQRPAIGSFMPHESGVTFIIDVGTNLDCKPIQLLQFGIMGSILVNHLLGIERPKVGLLNIGEESSKGNETIQTAYQLLAKSPINFAGNVEGRDILRGSTDVIVCDGFVGNVMLKFGESIGRMVSLTLKRKIRGNLFSSVGHFLMQPKIRSLLNIFDFQEYGGAPLLGVKGTCLIGHGRSTPRAIWSAITETYKMIQSGVSRHIEEAMLKMKGDLSEG